jgi:hypothetical protein
MGIDREESGEGGELTSVKNGSEVGSVRRRRARRISGSSELSRCGCCVLEQGGRGLGSNEMSAGRGGSGSGTSE